jgi:hypothetical protein
MWHDLAKTYKNNINITYLINISYIDIINEKIKLKKNLFYKSFKEIRTILRNILMD